MNYEFIEIESIEEVEETYTVYDLQVEDNHNFFANNLLVHNCSEIFMGVDTCRLMSMNLLGFIDNPWTKEAKFNFDLWFKNVYNSQKLIDDLVDLEIEAIDRILSKIDSDPEPDNIKMVERETWQTFKINAINGRRTGLGLTALGDAIAALGLKYDSDEALILTEKIMRTKCEAEFNASIDMAEQRGPFLGFDPEIEKTSQFIQMMEVEFPQLYKRMMKVGRRNNSLSTIPPAGTLSTLINSTSGCEPCYTISYKRRKKVTENQEFDEVDAQGDKWKIYDVYHKGVKEWMRLNNSDDPKESPYYNSDANSVNWKKRIELLSVCQKYTTHSISHTINLPRGTTKETVSDIFMYAHEKGLKGCSVFADGSRENVLISGDRKKQVEKTVQKRPKSLPCDINSVKIQGEQWIVIVGKVDNIPYEVFAGKAEHLQLPKKFKEGKVVKNGKIDGRSTYDLSVGVEDDELVVKDIVGTFENNLYGAVTRLTSLLLRSGTPVKNICESLSKDKPEDFQGMSKVLSRVLKKYIPDGEKLDKTCPACGQDTLRYESGCISCINPECGYSKCG